VRKTHIFVKEAAVPIGAGTAIRARPSQTRLYDQMLISQNQLGQRYGSRVYPITLGIGLDVTPVPAGLANVARVRLVPGELGAEAGTISGQLLSGKEPPECWTHRRQI
jgi:hypothetical protein